VYSALSLVSLYHNSIISRRLKQVQRLPVSPFARPSEKEGTVSDAAGGKDGDVALGQALPLPSDHTRYTEYFSRHSSTYRTASRALVVIGYVQLLLEMMVVRGRKQEGKDVGRWKRWKLLVWLEGVK
jgi:peroxin-16